MADTKSKTSDPTVKSSPVGEDYPEGTHPLHPLKDQTDAASNKKYNDNPEKPDPSTVASVEVVSGG